MWSARLIGTIVVVYRGEQSVVAYGAFWQEMNMYRASDEH